MILSISLAVELGAISERFQKHLRIFILMFNPLLANLFNKLKTIG